MRLPPPPRARKKKGPKKPPPPNPAYEGLFKFLSTTFWASYIAPMAPGTMGMIVGLGVWWVLGKLALQPFLHFAILCPAFKCKTSLGAESEPCKRLAGSRVARYVKHQRVGTGP